MTNTNSHVRRKKFFNRTLIVTSLLMVVLLSMCTKKHMHKKKAEITTEINAFITDSIVPELKEVRLQLDQVLTAAEKEQIATMRETSKTITEKAIALHIQMAQTEKGETYTLTDEEIAFIKSAKKASRDIIIQCWGILDNHQQAFDDLHMDRYPQMIAWHNGIMQTLANNVPFHHGHGKKHSMHHMKIEGLDQLGAGNMAPVFLLLYEPETNFPLDIFQNALVAHGS